MKKSIVCLMTVFLTVAILPTNVKAATEPVTTTTPPPNPADEARANVLIQRLGEINDMDKSSLKSSEKRELRKEVRSSKKELSNLNGGVYISVGAIIIILLLLIILF